MFVKENEKEKDQVVNVPKEFIEVMEKVAKMKPAQQEKAAFAMQIYVAAVGARDDKVD